MSKIIKKKELPESAVIKGFTFLKPADEDKQDFSTIIENKECCCYNNNTKKFGIVKGYAKIEGTVNDYVEVKTNGLIILIPLLLALLICCGILAGSMFSKSDEPEEIPVINAIGDEWDGEMPSNNDKTPLTSSIEIPGYTFAYVSEEEQTIKLVNPERNTVYFKYIISMDGETLVETEYIKPNSQIEVNMYEKINTPGEYELDLYIATADVETNEPCNGANQTFTLKVY